MGRKCALLNTHTKPCDRMPIGGIKKNRYEKFHVAMGIRKSSKVYGSIGPYPAACRNAIHKLLGGWSYLGVLLYNR